MSVLVQDIPPSISEKRSTSGIKKQKAALKKENMGKKTLTTMGKTNSTFAVTSMNRKFRLDEQEFAELFFLRLCLPKDNGHQVYRGDVQMIPCKENEVIVGIEFDRIVNQGFGCVGINTNRGIVGEVTRTWIGMPNMDKTNLPQFIVFPSGNKGSVIEFNLNDMGKINLSQLVETLQEKGYNVENSENFMTWVTWLFEIDNIEDLLPEEEGVLGKLKTEIIEIENKTYQTVKLPDTSAMLDLYYLWKNDFVPLGDDYNRSLIGIEEYKKFARFVQCIKKNSMQRSNLEIRLVDFTGAHDFRRNAPYYKCKNEQSTIDLVGKVVKKKKIFV
jgi:hypothetical protein